MQKKLVFLSGGIVLLFMQQICLAVETDLNDVIRLANLKPVGEYYEANVPDTLDLSERAGLLVHGITDFLNEKKNYECYGHGFFNVEKPYLTSVWGGAPNWGKITESLLFARVMSGSTLNLDIEQKSIKGMIAYVQADGSTPMARIMMALITLNQLSPNPKLVKVIEQLNESFYKNAKYENDYAYFYNGSADNNDTKLGIMGYGANSFINGTALRAISRWAKIGSDANNLELARKVKNFAMKPEFWTAEAEPKVVVSSEHGHFTGHHHSYCAALLGVLWYADATNDARLKQFVRDGYEYLRNFGIARIGLFGEMCTTGDMTLLATRLSETGVGDYWEDVDQYVRNQLAERQITDAKKLQKAVKSAPILGRIYPGMPEALQQDANKMFPPPPLDPLNETEDNVVQRCEGVYLSDSINPSYIPKVRLMWVICCTGNCPPALYAVWDNIVKYKDGSAQINLLLNRASQWLDIDSYIPYEGKVVIRNKQAKNISVRIPRWADKNAIKCSINNKSTLFFWAENYLVLSALHKNDVITIEFPMVSTTETYTLKWKDSDFWKECTDPGKDWKPLDNPDKFTFYFKGNTLVDISPRPQNAAYPLYQRDELKQNKAPMKKVKRYISPVIPKY